MVARSHLVIDPKFYTAQTTHNREQIPNPSIVLEGEVAHSRFNFKSCCVLEIFAFAAFFVTVGIGGEKYGCIWRNFFNNGQPGAVIVFVTRLANQTCQAAVYYVAKAHAGHLSRQRTVSKP